MILDLNVGLGNARGITEGPRSCKVMQPHVHGSQGPILTPGKQVLAGAEETLLASHHQANVNQDHNGDPLVLVQMAITEKTKDDKCC